jgi:hypothetical protein
MKSLLLSALFLSASAYSQVNARLIKVLDGSRAVCKTKLDISENRLGAYRLNKKSVDLSQETLKIDMGLEFFQCDEFNGEIGFKKIGLMETFSQTNFMISEKMTVETLKAESITYRDGDYKVFSKLELNTRSSGVTMEVALTDLLSESDYSRLHAGETVTAALDSILVKLIKITHRDTEFKDRFSFGAFRLLMEIKIVDGVLKAQLI